MPVVSIDVRDGDPTVQASGEHRGVIQATFADGRIKERQFRAPGADAWNDLVANVQAEFEARQQADDSVDGVSADVEVTANGEASIQQRAVAYLRAAMEQEDCFEGYRLLDKFNDFRNQQGWNLDQVRSGLASAGLEEEEWEQIKTAFQYLSAAGRPGIMNSYKAIQKAWEGR